MTSMSWIKGLLRQEPLHGIPELVEILAALPVTFEILLELLRVSRRIDQPCLALRSSKSAYSVSPSSAWACRSAAMVSELGTFTANGKP